uniref:diacylglycerol O-acyltransferase n=1 Tax=Aegilops tauschii TaxID=37682 RepID=M8BP61_AEGTA
MGLGTPVNLPVFRAGIQTELPRFPRFRSIQVLDGSNNGKPHWVQTTVNLDDHIILPRLDPAVSASDPDKAVEDYVSSLSTLPMDRSRPLWEFHFLDFATSEATSTTVLRLHHSIGDGMSIMTLLMASSRSTADRARLPAMPPLPRRTGAIYQQRTRPPLSSIGDYLAWIWSYFVLTINDVLVGVTSAALSKYYFRKSGDAKTKRIHLRSILPVNIRPLSSRQTYVTKVETGNQVSILICPFHIALHDDLLEYVHKAC